MAKHQKTLDLIEHAKRILLQYHPMTVRQVYYQLVSSQIIENLKSEYNRVSTGLVYARQEGIIPWEHIEDRLRQPREVSMWDGVKDFSYTVERAYRRNVWTDQPGYVEVWLEKDALSGIFESELDRYGVTLNVGRGFDRWDSIYRAAGRFGTGEGVTVLYFGDFDPSGEEMVTSLKKRLLFFGSNPEVRKCALTPDDILSYNPPPDFTKKTDTRTAKFIEKYGDMAVELDALPVDVLRQRIISEIEGKMDLEVLAKTRSLEERERESIRKALQGLGI